MSEPGGSAKRDNTTEENGHQNQSESLSGPHGSYLDPAMIKHAYEERKAETHAILPSFEASRASMHFVAPANQEEQPFLWTRLAEDKQLSVYEKLRGNIHGKGLLARHRYRLDPYMKIADFEKWRKCKRCHKNKKQTKGNKYCNYHPNATVVEGNYNQRFHTCCGKLEACKISSWHEWESMSPVFEDLYASFIETPPADSSHPKRRAVIVDCEMVGLPDGHSALARLCAVDYLAGEVLIDCFVDPVEQVIDYRTSYSGVTAQTLAKAKNTGNCLPNWPAARDALLHLVDAETIIIGAAAHHDLEILRLVHTNVVDIIIVSQQRVDKHCKRQWGLKTLCKELLNLKIQTAVGHDPLEDCLATREIMLCVTYTNEAKFGEWIAVKQKEEEQLEAERQRLAIERKRMKLEEHNDWD